MLQTVKSEKKTPPKTKQNKTKLATKQNKANLATKQNKTAKPQFIFIIYFLFVKQEFAMEYTRNQLLYSALFYHPPKKNKKTKKTTKQNKKQNKKTKPPPKKKKKTKNKNNKKQICNNIVNALSVANTVLCQSCVDHKDKKTLIALRAIMHKTP